MKIFDDKTNQIKTSHNQTGNNWDVFEPPVYTPDISKFRTEYIRSISAKIAEVIASVDDGEGDPNVEVILRGEPNNRSIEFKFHNLKGSDGYTPDIEAIAQNIDNIVNILSGKANDSEFQALKNLVYSLHATPGHTYSPSIYFKNSNPTLHFEAKLSIGNDLIPITSTNPNFVINDVPYSFTKRIDSTSKIHKYEFIDTNHTLNNSINQISVNYYYKGENGVTYNGNVKYKGVSVVYFGKSNKETISQETAQEIINTLTKSTTPVSSLATTLNLYNIIVTQPEAEDADDAPFFYFAIPEDVTAGSKFYVKGGSPQFASDLVSLGTFPVNVNDVCGQRVANYRFYRSSSRQGAGDFTIYII